MSSSITHLPGMRYMREDEEQSVDDKQQHWREQEKHLSGFYPDYSQSAQAYEELLRSRSFLVDATIQQQQQQHYSFSPQQMYGTSPTYFTHSNPTNEQPPQQQQKRPIRKRRRPPHSYASLIAQAILTSRDQRLTLREIYEWVQTRYPHLYEANETGWQVSIS